MAIAAEGYLVAGKRFIQATGYEREVLVHRKVQPGLLARGVGRLERHVLGGRGEFIDIGAGDFAQQVTRRCK